RLLRARLGHGGQRQRDQHGQQQEQRAPGSGLLDNHSVFLSLGSRVAAPRNGVPAITLLPGCKLLYVGRSGGLHDWTGGKAPLTRSYIALTESPSSPVRLCSPYGPRLSWTGRAASAAGAGRRFRRVRERYGGSKRR